MFRFQLYGKIWNRYASFTFQDVEDLMALAPEKVLLKWMNFHLKKAGYDKSVSNFSSDLKVTGTSICLAKPAWRHCIKLTEWHILVYIVMTEKRAL